MLGWLALAVGVIAAFAAAVIFFANLQLDRASDGGGDVAQETGIAPPSPPTFPASDYLQSRFPKISGGPLIGVNYTHYAFPNCSFHKTYVLAWYHKPGAAKRVHDQLMQMRENGIESIRTVVWHDETGQNWGPIPTPDGELREPFRTNLARYTAEVRRFGFARLTIAFEPERTHNPLLRRYEPTNFADNWRFIRAVRSVVKRNGPADTRFDLLGEGAPNETPTSYEPLPKQTGEYLRRLYRLYVRRFGNRDVTVSTIAGMKPATPTNRLENLIRILRSSGAPLPRWYDVHIGFEPAGASYALQNTEETLRVNGQRQPLTINDLGYDNAAIAQVIKRWLRRTGRRLEEVSPWYTHVPLGCQVSPPYAPGAYGDELPASG